MTKNQEYGCPTCGETIHEHDDETEIKVKGMNWAVHVDCAVEKLNLR